MGAFIPDGYTADGYVAEERLGQSVLWEGVKFKYRPAIPAEIEALRISSSVQQAERKRNEYLTKHLVEWDLVSGGQPVEITPENCARLNKTFRDALLGIIDGSRHNDDHPELEALSGN